MARCGKNVGTAVYQAHIERDVRSVLQIGGMEAFERFVRLCAGRIAQPLNLSAMGADCGISHVTAQCGPPVLEASLIIYLLRPPYENFSRRLIKSPKPHFMDTGLLCDLLHIRSPNGTTNNEGGGCG